MSNIKNVFDISGRAMAAQLIRLNTVASNLANAGNIAGSEEEAYRAIKPVFETKFAEHAKTSGLATVDAVEVKRINAQPERNFMPEHPQADKEGYVYKAAVNVDQEMVEMYFNTYERDAEWDLAHSVNAKIYAAMHSG